jgi:hypothetical protein
MIFYSFSPQKIDLEPGQTVRVKNDNQKKWSLVGVVSGYGSTPRSYIVETSEGKKMWRNRRHLQAVPKAVADDILEDDILEDDILEDDILEDDILEDDILEDDILQAIPENVPEINPERQEEWQIEEIQKEHYRIRQAIPQADVLYVNQNGTLKNIDIFQRY